MDGIRLIRLLDVVPVTAAENAEGVVPRSIVVTTEGELRAVDQVLLNGVQCPEFVVYGPHKLVAQVPAPLAQETITEIIVLSAVPSLSERSVIELGVGVRVGRISGPQRLLQNFVRLLLRTQGTSIYRKTLGGGLSRTIGRNITEQVAGDVAVAVSAVRQQILAAQSLNTAIPANERLLSAEIAGYKVDSTNASIYVTVLITTQDRKSSAATLVA